MVGLSLLSCQGIFVKNLNAEDCVGKREERREGERQRDRKIGKR